MINGIISGLLAFGLFGFLSMMGIFGGGAGAQAGQMALANMVMWGGIGLGVLGILFNVLGQIRYHKLQESDSKLIPLLMMYSCVFFTVMFFAFCLIFVFES